MPMVAFFPWATITERLVFGPFQIVPCAEILAQPSAVPYGDSVTAILKTYGHRRPVDRQHVPLLVTMTDEPFADLTDEQRASAFEFRLRLTFSALTRRDFFGLHYCNSDCLRLVIQGFTREPSGAILVVTRRRDGQTNNIVSRDAVTVARPQHVHWCEVPRDMDVGVLRAVEVAMAKEDETAARLFDAIQVFVGANTDSPEVSLPTELVDSVSAFSRLFGAWNERDTVAAFAKTLPPDPEPDVSWLGERVSKEPLRSMLNDGRSIREAWLRDAYLLRSQFSHGRISEAPYKSAWAPEEHLLLAAFVFPLVVKAVLAALGYYQWTEQDQTRSDAFDALATLNAFASTTSGAQSHPWIETISKSEMRQWIKAVTASLGAEADAEEAQEPASPPRADAEPVNDETGRVNPTD